MVQDIKITPSGAGDKIPQMLFTGSGATAPNMELNVRPDSRLSYESTDGEVFSISPGLQSGVIFAVKDISGLDQISINASGDTYLAPYYGNVRVGATGVIHEDYALDVQGKGLRVGASGTVLTRASAPAVTTDTLYNVGGSLYFDGSTVGGGSAAGAIHQIQYNDGSGFAGDSQFLFSKANSAFTNDRVLVVSGVIIANSGDAAYANSISIGSGAYVGHNATSYGTDCIAIGTRARTSKGAYSVVIGHNARDLTTHNDGRNVCIGAGANVDGSSYRNVSIGMDAKCGVNANNSIAIGPGSQVIWGQEGVIAIGQNAGQNGAVAGHRSIALGGSTIVKEDGSIAIGFEAYCKNGRGVALGWRSQAGRTYGSSNTGGAVSIGSDSYAGEHAVALGKGAQAPDGGFVLASGSALTDVLLSGVMKDHLTMPNGQQFIQMATAAQTTDLMQWQNSAGVNVASMTPSGVLNTYGVVASGAGVRLERVTPTVTTDALYNIAGTLYFNGSTVGGGSSAGTEAQVQYNDGSSGFAGDAGFTYYKDKAGFQNDRTLVVSGVIIASSGDANYKNSITIGSGVYQQESGSENIIIGTQSWAKHSNNNVIIGKGAYARADGAGNPSSYNVIIGESANCREYHATNNVVIGRGATVYNRGDECIVIGYGAASYTEHDNGSIYIGRSAGYGSDSRTGVVTIGSSSNAHANGAVSLGKEARSQGEHAISLGYHAGGNFAGNYNGNPGHRYGAINLGAYTHADGPMSIAIGHRVVAPTKHFVLGSGSAQTSVMLSGVFGSYLALPNGQQFRQIASAAQTSDMTQWQNSAGTNVAAMTPSGVLNVYDIRTSGEAVCIGDGAVNSYAASSNSVTIGKNAESTAIYDVAIGVNAKVDYSSSFGGVAIGSSANALQSRTVAIGNNSKATTTRAVAVGGQAEAEGHGAVSIGFDTESKYGSSIAVGADAKANADVAVSIGHHAVASTSSYGAIALGAYTDAIGERSVAIGCEAQAHGTSWVIASGDTSAEVGISGVFGSYAAIPNDQKLAVGGNVPTYTVDALGHGAMVRATGVIVGNSGIVLSDNVPAVTDYTLYRDGSDLKWNGSAIGGGSAAGTEAQVQYNDGSSGFAGDAGFTYYKDKAGFQNDRTLVVSGVIIASSGDANYKNSITIGSGVYQEESGSENIIIGTQSWAKHSNNNVIIGKGAYARADGAGYPSSYNVIIGEGTHVMDYHATSNVVIGRGAAVQSRGDDCVVIGYGAVSNTEHDSGSVYIGKSAGYGGDTRTTVCTVGGNSNAHANGAVSLGYEARAQGEHAISLGYHAGGNFAGNYNGNPGHRYGAINLGAYTHADGPMSIAIGHRVVAPTKHFVLGSGSAQESVMLSGVFGSYLALPNGQQFRQIASAAQTSDLTQWQNSAGTNVAAMTPSGILNVYDIRTSGTTISLGQGAAGTGSTAVAIGYNSTASAAGTVSLGYDAQATASYAITIGNSARGDGQRAVVIGDNADTNNNNDTVVIGRNSDATGSSAVAIGRNANAVSTAVALGTYSYAAGTYATALGAYTDATGERSVAIGYEAQAHGTSWVIASGDTSAEVGISGVFGSYVAIPNDQQLAVGSNVPQYAIDVVRHSGVIRASGVKGHISTNPDAATVTFDLNAATTHAVTLGGNRTLAVSNANVGDKFLIRLQQPASSPGKTVTWFSHIKWAGGTAPTLTSTANKADLLGFLAASGDGGSNIWYDGFVVGQNI